jgi:hypothetical protein
LDEIPQPTSILLGRNLRANSEQPSKQQKPVPVKPPVRPSVGSENEAGDDTTATKKAPHRGGAFYFVQTGYRESSDSPRLKAFCRVAPSVRFKVRAMLAARVFLRAIVFNVRTSDDVHDRRFDFLGI